MIWIFQTLLVIWRFFYIIIVIKSTCISSKNGDPQAEVTRRKHFLDQIHCRGTVTCWQNGFMSRKSSSSWSSLSMLSSSLSSSWGAVTDRKNWIINHHGQDHHHHCHRYCCNNFHHHYHSQWYRSNCWYHHHNDDLTGAVTERQHGLTDGGCNVVSRCHAAHPYVVSLYIYVCPFFELDFVQFLDAVANTAVKRWLEGS